MPVVKRQSLEMAVHNISRYGDTDVFPFPLENHWFHDDHGGVVDLLEKIDADFNTMITEYPVVFVKSLSSVGYSGFRAATQLDPIWNAYLLALVIELGPDIEAARVRPDRNTIFSYRYSPDAATSQLFSRDLGWHAYQKEALARTAAASFIVATDISDFYPRIYHHRLENALQRVTANQDAVGRIMRLLNASSEGTSYGLPVGGNASRILAELLLNAVDHLLLTHKVEFVRFVDDYCMFAGSRQDLQKALVALSEYLLHEGLSLARAKTRLMTQAEFVRGSPVAEETVAESADESEARKFLKLRLTYDPYSSTADDDYDKLSTELKHFDIAGMLAREFRKSRVDEVLVRSLVKSIRFLAEHVREQTVRSLLDNFELLYPVFPTVMILLRTILPELRDTTRTYLFAKFRELVRDDSHIVLVPTNLAFVVRLLALDPDSEADALLIQTYDRPAVNMMIKRDILLAMARKRATYWLSPALQQFSTITPWQKRSLLVASYVLGDEGKHWRRRVEHQLGEVDKRFLTWVGGKNNGGIWEIPL